jgi:colanic acid biosynthesis glycosyl transferase WcaI
MLSIKLLFGQTVVLIKLLTPEAGLFSAPSKVLSYLCAGRAQLMAGSLRNHSAKMILTAQAGIVVLPDNLKDFLSSADKLYNNATFRNNCAKNARIYADKQFDIKRIGDEIVATILTKIVVRESSK